MSTQLLAVPFLFLSTNFATAAGQLGVIHNGAGSLSVSWTRDTTPEGRWRVPCATARGWPDFPFRGAYVYRTDLQLVRAFSEKKINVVPGGLLGRAHCGCCRASGMQQDPVGRHGRRGAVPRRHG